MSKHINGHMDNVNGCHYRIVGLSTNAYAQKNMLYNERSFINDHSRKSKGAS